MRVSLDNLILYVEDVSAELFNAFRYRLEVAETYGEIPKVQFYIGKGISQYHYNLTVGQGGGAVHIGYKHNGSKERLKGYTLRLEVNPSKQLSKSVQKGTERFADVFAETFMKSRKLIKGVDIAFDVPVPLKDVMPVSLTGRERSIIKGTTYFGDSGQDGRLKVYDKKKELQKKQGVQVVEEHLTRIEYSSRLEKPITINSFGKIENLNINKLYQVSEMKIEDADPLVKACIIALNTGQMEMKELTRTYQTKTKKALAAMGLLNLDQNYNNAKKEIMEQIKSYLIVSNDTILAP